MLYVAAFKLSFHVFISLRPSTYFISNLFGALAVIKLEHSNECKVWTHILLITKQLRQPLRPPFLRCYQLHKLVKRLAWLVKAALIACLTWQWHFLLHSGQKWHQSCTYCCTMVEKTGLLSTSAPIIPSFMDFVTIKLFMFSRLNNWAKKWLDWP